MIFLLLALDISTNIIGWAKKDNDRIVECGYVKLTNSKGEPKELHERLDLALEYFRKFDNIDLIAAEAALQRFTKGKTQAVTINKLIAMNFGLTYTLSREWNVPVNYLDVNSARRIAGIKVAKQPKGQKKDPDWTKKIVTANISKRHPSLYSWADNYGKYKSDFDVADAIVIAEAAK